jgi:hypothetical protein
MANYIKKIKVKKDIKNQNNTNNTNNANNNAKITNPPIAPIAPIATNTKNITNAKNNKKNLNELPQIPSSQPKNIPVEMVIEKIVPKQDEEKIENQSNEKKKRGRKPKNDENEKNEKNDKNDKNEKNEKNNIITEKNEVFEKLEEDENPKKRGRKPKPKNDNETIDDDEKTPKKRGRKPKEKIYSIINPQETIISNVNEEENIILHLPVEIDNFEKPIEQMTEDELLIYNPDLNEPEPWNANSKDNFAKIDNGEQNTYINNTKSGENSAIISENMMNSMKKMDNYEESNMEYSESVNNALEDNDDDIDDDEKLTTNKKGNKINDFFKVYDNVSIKSKKDTIEKEKDIVNVVQKFQGVDFEYDHFDLKNEETCNYQILNVFSEANKRKEWPQQIGIACWWCCHTFNTPPIPIPFKIMRGKFYVYGCCCSYNCAASYIFRENKSDMWEKYSLLNLLYKKIHNCSNVRIRLAPTPLLLQLFGGPKSISEYRESFLMNKKDYNILEPPLVSVNPHIEESNYEVMNRGKIDNIYSSYTQQSLMKLKRNKQVLKNNNTLDSYMAIQINE